MDPSHWDERYAASDLVWSATPNVWVTEIVSGMPPGRALDIGAGEGRNAFWLCEQGWEVVAADFSPVGVERMRELAGERFGDRFRAVVADATQPAPGGPDAYDLVLLSYIHLPAEAWRETLAHAVAAARPGGQVLVIQHALRNLVEGIGGPQDPTILHDPDALLATAEGLSVTIEQSRFGTREVAATEPGEAPRTAYDTIVLLRKQ